MLKIGDRVQYKTTFLRSIGEYRGAICFAKGEVLGFEPFGTWQLTKVKWENDPQEDIPGLVRDTNLEKIPNES